MSKEEWFNRGFFIGVGVAALAVAAYIFTRKSSNKPKPTRRESQDLESRMDTNLTVSQVFDKQAQLNRAVQMIEIGTSQLLAFDEIRSIYIYSLDVIRDEYSRFTRDVRKRRRLIRKVNEQQYLNILLDYQDKINQLIERGRIELVEALQIDPSTYEESMNSMRQSQYRAEFFMLEQSIGRRLKEKMLRKRKLSDKTAIEILKYQLSFLRTKLYERYEEQLKKREVTETQIVNAIQTIIEDLIYEKYGYEEEHMIIKLSDPVFASKDEIRYLTEQIQYENEKLLSDLAGFRTNMQTIDYD